MQLIKYLSAAATTLALLTLDPGAAFGADAHQGDRDGVVTLAPDLQPNVEPQVQPNIQPHVEPQVQPNVEPNIAPNVQG